MCTAARTRCVCFCALSPWLVCVLTNLDRAQDISPAIRASITRVALLISLLATHCIPITAELVTEAHDVALRIVGEGPEGLRKLARRETGTEVLRALAMGRE